MSVSKMPAASIVEQMERTRRLDKIAIPLIPRLGIAGAYRKALADCDAQDRLRFPVTNRGKLPLKNW